MLILKCDKKKIIRMRYRLVLVIGKTQFTFGHDTKHVFRSEHNKSIITQIQTKTYIKKEVRSMQVHLQQDGNIT